MITVTAATGHYGRLVIDALLQRGLLIPGAVFGQRYPQMQRAIAAAVEARDGIVAYASFVHTDTSTLRLGEEHKQTEQELRSSGLPHVLLCNGAYTEMYTSTLGPALEHGAIIGSFGEGRISGPPAPISLRPPPSPSWPATTRQERSTNSAAPRSPCPIWPPRYPGRPASQSPARTRRSTSTPRP
ncbi:hypothetical protein ABZZ80_13730 [Streptomyces sp. NPDC006356]